MAWTLLGLVLVVEGLLWSFAPGLVEQMLAVLRGLTLDERRLAGLATVALGLVLIWVGRIMGGCASYFLTPS